MDNEGNKSENSANANLNTANETTSAIHPGTSTEAPIEPQASSDEGEVVKVEGQDEPKWYHTKTNIKPGYRSVLDGCVDSEMIFDLNNVEFMESFNGKDEYAKRRDYKDWTVVKCGIISHGGREINYKAVGLPSRVLWREYSENTNRMIRYIDENGEIQTKYWMGDGNFVASKNMPSSVKLEQRDVGGGGGYWKNIHILIQDNQIVFDEGRKTITGAKPGSLAEKLVPVFKEVYEYIWHYTGKDMPPLESRAAATARRDLRFAGHNEAEPVEINVDPIGDPSVYYSTTPNQEAPVQSIFNQMIAAGYLPYFQICTEGYKKQYDCDLLYFIEEHSPHLHKQHESLIKEGCVILDLVAEYKSSCEKISQDIKEDGSKAGEDLDLIVCWDIEEDPHNRKWKSECQSVRNVEDPTKEEFYGTTHHLKLSKVSREIPVIALETLISFLNGDGVEDAVLEESEPSKTPTSVDVDDSSVEDESMEWI